MRLRLLLLPILIGFASSCASISDQTQDAIGAVLPFIGPSDTRIAAGLRAGLELGAVEAVDRLSAASSFSANSPSRMPIPAELKRVVLTMKRLKRDTEIATLEDKLNDAARACCADALPALRDTIASLPFDHPKSVLHGRGAAATEVLHGADERLVAALLPIVRRRMEEVGARQAGDSLVMGYQSIPFAHPVSCDLEQAVALTCAARLLGEIGDFEVQLRNTPSRRNSELLRRVFAEQDDE